MYINLLNIFKKSNFVSIMKCVFNCQRVFCKLIGWLNIGFRIYEKKKLINIYVIIMNILN